MTAAGRKNLHSDDEPSRAGSLTLVAGGLALDFANTASGRAGERHLDHLRHGADVIAWARHAGLLDEAAAARLDDKIAASDPAFASFLEDAVSLREAVAMISPWRFGSSSTGASPLVWTAARLPSIPLMSRVQ